MHAILLAPHFPHNQRYFLRGLKNVGAQVTGICDAPFEHLDDEVRSLLDGYEYVPSVTHEESVFDAVERIQARGPWVHRFEATIESHVEVCARVRERTGIPGVPADVIELCRDKFVMKRFLRERGIPCAANAEVWEASDARAFVEEVGYPVILKPRDGAGAYRTYRLDDDEALDRALAEVGLDETRQPFVMEEYLTGHEGFFDTLTIDGEVVFEAICHYYPGVLHAMRTRWISPQIVTTNRIGSSGYDEVRALGRKVIRELGITTSATHMEWFFGPEGLKFSEIGARPPGCNYWDVYCATNDFDLYTEWARAVCWGDVHALPSRMYSGGLIALRPSQDGHISGYLGVEDVRRRYGDWLVKENLPPPGTPTQPVEAGYLANAWFTVRHPDYDECRRILDDIGESVTVLAR